MNVVCGQCGTGYEFDDALVSERGTTVRCTQCGFQFRVRPSTEHGFGPERWIVRKTTGEEYIFRTLSELQRAISQRRVVIDDSLSRDGTTFRPMRELSELDCFFDPTRNDGSSLEVTAVRDAAALMPDAAVARGRAAPSPRPAPQPPSVTPTAQMIAPALVTARKQTPPGGFATAAHQGAPSSLQKTMRTPAVVAAEAGGGGSAVMTPAASVAPSVAGAVGKSESLIDDRTNLYADRTTPVAQERLPRRRRGHRHAEWEEGFASPAGADAAVPSVASAGAGPARVVSQGMPPPRESAVAVAGLSTTEPLSSSSHSPITVPPPERSMGLRWIVGLVLLGGLGLIVGTVGRDYLEQFRTGGVELPSEQNARVEQYLAQGDELYRAGDLEEARAHFDKASALAEGSAEVALRLMRIEATRADIEWLRLRLLSNDDTTARQVAEQRFAERSQKLEQRVSEYERLAAGRVAPEGVGALVDAHRIAGQRERARALVEQAGGLGADSQAAYASAMLDVAEQEPSWPSVTSRLRQAVSGERGLGRAQAALVYALARAGDVAGARQQLDVLSGFRRSHPLVEDLRRFIAETEPADRGAAERSEAQGSAKLDGAEPPTRVTPEGASGRQRGGMSEDAVHSADPMRDAAEARAAGEIARAGRLYTLALSREPGNVAAMTGLGDVARSQGNTDIALSHYGAALRQNPNYTPAVLACADLKWATGDREGAVELYRRLGASAPERVARRLAEYEKAKASSSAPPSTAATTGMAPTAPTAASPNASPDVSAAGVSPDVPPRPVSPGATERASP